MRSAAYFLIFNFVPTREYESLLFSGPHPATEMPSAWILYKVYNPFVDPANAIDEVERLGFLSRIGIVLRGQRPRELVRKLEFCQGPAATQNIKRFVCFRQPAPTVRGSMLRQPGADVKVRQELLRHADAQTTMNISILRRSANKSGPFRRRESGTGMRMVLARGNDQE